jgi:hypothetical protein
MLCCFLPFPSFLVAAVVAAVVGAAPGVCCIMSHKEDKKKKRRESSVGESQLAGDFMIKPASTPELDTSQWPLLLKVSTIIHHTATQPRALALCTIG